MGLGVVSTVSASPSCVCVVCVSDAEGSITSLGLSLQVSIPHHVPINVKARDAWLAC